MYKKYLFNVVFAVGLLTICTVSFAQKSEYKKLLKGDPDVSALEEFAKQFPNFAPVYFKIGDHYHLNDKDKAIDELFKKADEQHELVQKYYKESQAKHKAYIKMVDEVSIAIAESNKKHEQYIETRNEAQKNHEKAMEMRDHIVQVRGERRRRFEESKKLIKDQNVKARKAVLDKDKLKKIADDSLSELKNGKKISL